MLIYKTAGVSPVINFMKVEFNFHVQVDGIDNFKGFDTTFKPDTCIGFINEAEKRCDYRFLRKARKQFSSLREECCLQIQPENYNPQEIWKKPFIPYNFLTINELKDSSGVISYILTSHNLEIMKLDPNEKYIITISPRGKDTDIFKCIFNLLY